jgi:hypothetical protein
MVRNKNMVDESQQLQGGAEDEALRALFAQSLVDEPLPTPVLDRLAAEVVGELRRNPAPTHAPAEAREAPWRAALSARMEHVRRRIGSLSPNQSLLLAGAGAMAALLLFVGISRITPRPLSATAAVSGGDVTVLNRHSDKFRVQGDGDLLKLREGDQVLTGEGSVQITHLQDQVTTIESNSHVELTRLDDADGGRQLALTVHDGLVHTDIDSPLGAADQYLILTPGVAVTAVGTDFTVEAISDEETLVTALEGTVDVRMGDQSVTVRAGQLVDAIVGHMLTVQKSDSLLSATDRRLLITVDAGSGLQLYAQPRSDAAPVGRLPAGRIVAIEAEDKAGGWVRICCVADRSAWVKVQ